MSTAAQTREFLTERSPDGGVDLFRRAPMGFILVDTFDTEVSAQRYVATVRTPQTGPVAGGIRQAMPEPPAAY